MSNCYNISLFCGWQGTETAPEMGVTALVAALKACDTVVDLELPSGRRADGDTTNAHNPGDPTSRHQHTLPGPAGRHRVVPLKTGELATVAALWPWRYILTTFVLILYFSSYFVCLTFFHLALFCTRYIPTIFSRPYHCTYWLGRWNKAIFSLIHMFAKCLKDL